MPKQRLDPDTITRTAMAIVEEGGIDALSLSSVAQRLDVGPSALYSHVDGLEGLRQLVAMGAMRNMVTHVRRAAIGVSGPGAVRSVCDAYRGFALDHPGQFRSTMAPPLSAGDEMASAHDELLDVLALVYQGAGLGWRRVRLWRPGRPATPSMVSSASRRRRDRPPATTTSTAS